MPRVVGRKEYRILATHVVHFQSFEDGTVWVLLENGEVYERINYGAGIVWHEVDLHGELVAYMCSQDEQGSCA